MENETVEPMPDALIRIMEAMQKHAKTCETASHDMTQQALTGENCEKDKNTQDAKEWMIASNVWLEAKALVRGFVDRRSGMEGTPNEKE